VAVTLTSGSSTSGNSCTALNLKDRRPAIMSSANTMITMLGLRIDQAEKFI
jgi:hypothetical protein